ncbi:hypothetical protein [Bradyrhizobium sp. USDA 4508]
MAEAKDARSIRDELGYTVEEAGRMIGLGRSASYRAAELGLIPAHRLGIKLLIVPKKPWDAVVRRLRRGTKPKPTSRRKSARSAINATP